MFKYYSHSLLYTLSNSVITLPIFVSSLVAMLVALADFDLNKDINNNPNFLDHDSIECKYNDEQSMISNFSSSKNPIAISINIQSLSSKFEKFSDIIANFELNNLFFDVIAIKETSQKTEVDDTTR